jgi:hypothetical protein
MAQATAPILDSTFSDMAAMADDVRCRRYSGSRRSTRSGLGQCFALSEVQPLNVVDGQRPGIGKRWLRVSSFETRGIWL